MIHERMSSFRQRPFRSSETCLHLDGMKQDSMFIKVVFAAKQPRERHYRVRLGKSTVGVP